MSSSLDWMGYAACRDEDPELFFPNSVGVAAQMQAERAMRVCAGCPVQDKCGLHRTATGASAGVWGGTYHRTHPPRVGPPPIRNHGTNAGYTAHLDRGEKPCDSCRYAHMVYNRKWDRR